MCTAITYRTKDFYFGRTLDWEHPYGEQVVVTPRNFPILFRDMGTMEHHYAIIGMALVAEGYPLYFDGVNEMGLAMAGLNFVGNAMYRETEPGKDNVASFEFIPWILGQCATVKEAVRRLETINLTDKAFSEELQPAQMHWLITDRDEAVTVECTREGLSIYSNPVGVLTNNPPFPEQLTRLKDYMDLSPRDPENRLSQELPLEPYSRGMGAMGLPGDLSSQSRFVRAAFVKMNARSGDGEAESVNQFFHMLGSVEQVRGCCEVSPGEYEITQYTSCCNCSRGIYYYTTYGNHRITGVDMHREELNGRELIVYPLAREEQIRIENEKKHIPGS